MQNTTKNKTAIFSVKPKYATLIFSGVKTVELRRTTPLRIEQGSRILFWESSPVKQLSGSARVKSLVSVHPDELWTLISDSAGISREEFDEYFEGAKSGVALFLSDTEEFDSKPKLSTLRRKLGFQPPQSFRYISNIELEYFEKCQLI